MKKFNKFLLLNVVCCHQVSEDEDTKQLTAEERIVKAKEVSHSRILTQEDFKCIRMSELAKQMQTRNSADKGKRKHSEVSSREMEGWGGQGCP